MRIDLDSLLTEQANSRSADIDSKSTEQVLEIINDEDAKVAGAVRRELPRIAEAVERIVGALKNGGRLFYLGAGTSGRLGVLDAAECPPTFGIAPGIVNGLIAGGRDALVEAVEGAEDRTDEVVNDLKAVQVGSGDIVVGLAASGRTPYAVAGLEFAGRAGAFTIAVCCTPESPLAAAAKLAITPLVGPEVITGSTRMKAGTAQKLVLNMLTTATMIRLGKVYGNLMVDVQPTNQKLKERAKRIVAEAAGIHRQQAGEVLEAAGWNSKTAIVMIKCACSAPEAERRLKEADGLIRIALENGSGNRCSN